MSGSKVKSSAARDHATKVFTAAGTAEKPISLTLTSQDLSSSLKEVHITYAAINNSRLSPGLFPQNNQLVALNITHSNLKAIGAEELKHLSHLEHLRLDHNEISSIDANAFAELTNLRQLTLSWNKLFEFPQRLGNLGKLELLDLSNNPFKGPTAGSYPVFPDPDGFFKSLNSLRVLNLANTGINRVPFDPLKAYTPLLTELDVSKNLLDVVLPHELWRLSNLRKINLKGNKLKKFEPESLSGLKLDELNMSEVPADILKSGVFKGLQVKHLDLSRMPGVLELRPDVLSDLSSSLISLNVTGNPGLKVRRREELSGMLPNLKELTVDK